MAWLITRYEGPGAATLADLPVVFDVAGRLETNDFRLVQAARQASKLYFVQGAAGTVAALFGLPPDTPEEAEPAQDPTPQEDEDAQPIEEEEPVEEEAPV
jgi:hypothetical protein